jgi:CBS domain-containing protein
MQHPICEVMQPLPLSVLPDDGAAWAWHRMRKEGVDVLPVVDFGELLGLVHARDLERRTARELARLQVRSVMRGDPAVAAPWAPVCAVLLQLLRNRQEAAVIVDRGHLVGLFTLDEAARRCGSALDAAALRH